MSEKSLSEVLKRFQTLSGEKVVPYIAFNTFAQEHGLFECTSEEVKEKLSGSMEGSYQHHLSDARETQLRALTESYTGELQHLVDVAKEIKDEKNKIALRSILAKYSKLGFNHWIGNKIPYWVEAVLLNAIGAGVGVFVVYLVVSWLVSKGFSGLAITPIPPAT